MTKLKVLAISALTVALALTTVSANPKARAYGACKLIDIRNDKILYNSDCKVVEKIENNGEATFKIKMEGRAALLFSSYAQRTKWMHGAQQVHFHDKGQGGVFKWDGFKLKVSTN